MFVASIMTPLYVSFGWAMQELYKFFDNYGLVIIIFTVILRALFIPLGVMQHKTMLKTQALAPQIDDLKRIYGKDKTGFQQANLELQKKNGISQLPGCLSSLLMIFLIWPVNVIVSAPLQYIAGLSTETITKIAGYLQSTGIITQAQATSALRYDTPLISALHTSPSAVSHVVNEGWMNIKDIMDLKFLGIDLGVVPSLNPSQLFGDQMSTYLPVLFLVVIATVTTFLFSKMMEWTSPMYKKNKEAKQRAKNNPARTAPTDPMQSSTKMMKFMMPAMTLFFSISMPASMTLYWIVTNLMSMLQQYIMYILYTKPTAKAAKN